MTQTTPIAELGRDQGRAKSGNQDDHIYAQMFSAILEQRLSPGTKLSEDVLGEIFQC